MEKSNDIPPLPTAYASGRTNKSPLFFGIGRRLLLAFLAISLFAFLSGIVAWFGLFYVRAAQDVVFKDVFPAVESAQQVAIASNTMIVRLPILFQSLEAKNLARESLSIGEARKQLGDTLRPLEDNPQGQKFLEGFTPLLNRLDEEVANMIALGGEASELIQLIEGDAAHLQKSVKTIVETIEDAFISQSDQTLGNAAAVRKLLVSEGAASEEETAAFFDRFVSDSVVELQQLSEILFRGEAILEELIAISDADSITRIRSLQQNLTLNFRIVINTLSRIDNTDFQARLAQKIESLSDAIFSKENLFQKKINFLDLAQRFDESRKRATNIGAEINRLTDRFVSQLQVSEREKINETIKATDYTQILLVLVTVLSLSAALFIYISYINNNLIKRLNALYEAVLEIVAGKLETAIQSTGSDEISDLESGIEQFRLERIKLKEADASLQTYAEDLQRSNDELKQFAYVASHDLRAPLRGINSLASWIEEDIAEENMDDVLLNLARLRGRIKRMDSLLQGILLYSRAGNVEENSDVVDPKALTQLVFDDHNSEGSFSLMCQSNFKELRVEPTFINQILSNIIGNAIKHHDKEDGVIHVDFKQDNHLYYLSICDDGPGIPEAMQERVFEIFHTLKPRDQLEASGMGLAIVKRLVERRRGTITVKKSHRGGAEFTLTWPRENKSL